MKIFSILQHVLFFLILILSTAPVSTDICPKSVKLHQSVTLSCQYQCRGLIQWAYHYNRSVLQAQCDQTSCWSEKGFTISHDQYLKGDNSLTITSADYSKRNTYVCECDRSDVTAVRLTIDPVFSTVQLKFNEDLKLNLTVPEPVEVIYKSRDSADEVICNVTHHTLWCKAEYTQTTSLSRPELTLSKMEPRHGGTYTVRDTQNHEEIQVYGVSVEDAPYLPKWGIVLIVLILLLLLCGLGLLMYKHNKRAGVKRRLRDVVTFVQQAEVGGQEDISKAEEKLDQLDTEYRNTEHSDKVSRFYIENTQRLKQRRKHLEREKWNRRLLHVIKCVHEAEDGTGQKIKVAVKKLDQLKQQYKNTEHSGMCSDLYKKKTPLLNWYRLQHGENQHLINARRKINHQLLRVKEFVQRAEKGKEDDVTAARREVEILDSRYWGTKYSAVTSQLCQVKRTQLIRVQDSDRGDHMTERTQATEGTEKNKLDQLEIENERTDYFEKVSMLNVVKNEQSHYQTRKLEVDEQIKQAESGSVEKIREVEKMINDLELQFITGENLRPVLEFCLLKKAEVFWYKLQHSEEELMPDRSTLVRKLEHVCELVQWAEEEKPSSEVDSELRKLVEMYDGTEDSELISVLRRIFTLMEKYKLNCPPDLRESDKLNFDIFN